MSDETDGAALGELSTLIRSLDQVQTDLREAADEMSRISMLGVKTSEWGMVLAAIDGIWTMLSNRMMYVTYNKWNEWSDTNPNLMDVTTNNIPVLDVLALLGQALRLSVTAPPTKLLLVREQLSRLTERDERLVIMDPAMLEVLHALRDKARADAQENGDD